MPLPYTLPFVIGFESYTDDFNRADNATVPGGNWTNSFRTIGISNNRAYSTGSPYGVGTYWNLATNDQQVKAKIYNLSATTDQGLILGSNSSATVMAEIWNNGTDYTFDITTSAPSGDWNVGVGQTNRARATGALANGDEIIFERVGNTHALLVAGKRVARWVDSGDAHPRDGAHRTPGVFINGDSSSGWDDWAAIDITAFTPLPKIETLTEDFATKDTAKFTWSGSADVSGGQLDLPCLFGGDYVPGFNQAIQSGAFSLVDSAVYVHVISVPTATGFNAGASFRLISTADPTDFIDMGWYFDGNMYWDESVNGGLVQGSTPYNATTHAWWRLRNTGGIGGTNFFEYSSDGSSWTTFTSRTASASIDITDVTLRASCGYGSANGAQFGSFTLDNLNIPSAPTGTIAATLQKVLFSGSGAQTQTGTIAATLRAATAALTGAQVQSGTIATTLPSVTASFTGAMAPKGVMAATVSKVTASLTGAQTQTGTLTATLQEATASLTGAMTPSGVIAATLQAATAALTGGQVQAGVLAATLQTALFSGSGAQAQTGVIAATLPSVTAALVYSPNFTGTIAATVSPVVAALSGVQEQSGQIAVTLQKATFSGVGAQVLSGVIAATVQPAKVSMSGAQAQTGILSAVLSSVTAALMGQQTLTGVIAVTVQPVKAALLGGAGLQLIAVTIQPPIFNGAGAQLLSGQINVTLRPVTFSGLGFLPGFGTLGVTLIPTQAHLIGVVMVSEPSALRMYVVVAENRTLEVVADPRLVAFARYVRTVLVAAENRTLTTAEQVREAIASEEDRTVVIGPGGRTAFVAAEDRTLRVPAEARVVVWPADMLALIP